MKNKFGVEYHLTDSCNLNCAGCSHYSSLIDDKIYIPFKYWYKKYTQIHIRHKNIICSIASAVFTDISIHTV